MTLRRLSSGLLLAAALSACERTEHHDHGAEKHGAEKPAGDAARRARGDAREVRLSEEAVAHSGIELGKVERRALGGGSAIPAEVEFEPSSTAHVGPLVSGRFTRVMVKLGERVKRHQLLGVVASSDASQARARLEQARARLSAAEAALKRQEQLSAEGIGAQRTLIEAETHAAELKAETRGLERQLAVFGSGASGELQLHSPIDGVVVSLHATLGDTASAEEPAFVVTDPSKVVVKGSVPELEIARITPGMAVAVRLHAFPELVLEGSLSYVAPALDPESRSLPVRVSLKEADARLKSGLFGSIELLGGAGGETRPLVVPVNAVVSLDGGSVVFVPAGEPHTFVPKPVEIGRRDAGFYELKSGLTEGAALVSAGAFTLKSALSEGELSEGHGH